jgi:superfamily II DNA or RNA helicase
LQNLILRPYQSDVLLRTREAFRQGFRRPLVVLPCGAGKTVLFAYMAAQSQAKGKTVWFLVHRKELLDQTIATFERFGIQLKTIHIGMIATYANHPERYPKPDFIIFDEAHFSMAHTWQKIINLYPDAYIVGLTATPCRLDGKPLGATYDTMIVGITTKELIKQGYLSKYRYFAPSVADLSGLKRKGSDFDPDSASELLMQRAVYGDVIESYRKYANGLQTICYCSSIKHSQAMAEEFRKAGISAVHFDGNTPAAERKQIVQDFRDKKIQVLCNVDLISVGFDVPDCWCCILLRPTMSTALHIQQAGRALRPQPGKTAIILDHVGNYTRHGLPDDSREWSLNSNLKPRQQYKSDGTLAVRQCAECYFTFPSGPDKCPNCGAEIKKTRQEIENIKKIHMEEVKQAYRQKVAAAVREKSDISECRNLSEIMAWCKQHGRKPGYGYYVAKARGLINRA